MKWHSFSEVVTDATSKFKKIKASDYKAQGQYKIIDQGKKPIAGYTEDASLVNAQLLPILIFGDHTRVLKYEDEPIALGADGAKALWINSDLAIPRYVYYYLRSIEIKEAGYSRHFKFLKEIEIPIPFNDGAPDFDYQIRTAHLLGKVEGLIAQRKQHLQQFDDLLMSVFLEMFGDPVRNEKGWDKPDLKAFGKISTGNTPPRSEPENYDDVFIEWIKTDNITGDAVFVTPSTEHLSEVGARRARTVTNGALLVACIAGSVESIGRAALTDRTVSFNQQINAIQPSQDVNPLYLYGLFKLSRSYIQSHATKGMKKILTKGDFEQITMIKPPLDLQNQFAVIAIKIEGIKSRYQKSLTDLEVLYGGLSQKAFKGKLDLSCVALPKQVTQPMPVDAPMPSAEVITSTELVRQLMQSAEPQGREELLTQWFRQYIANSAPATGLRSAQMLEDAWQALQTAPLHAEVEGEEVEEEEDESPMLLLADYDVLKTLVFTALEAGELRQTFDDDRNRVALTRQSAEWGTW